MNVKRNNCGMILVMLLVLGVLGVQAQRQFIMQQEFYDRILAADQLWFERSHRETSKEEILVNGVVVKTIDFIYESELKGGSHSYTKITEAGKVDVKENIVIGDNLFVRENAGAWTKGDFWKIFHIDHGSTLFYQSTSCDQYSVEPVTLNGAPLKLYEKFVVDTGTNQLTFIHDKEWVGLDGLLYRTQLSEGNLSPREEHRRVSTSREYDPIIKIEVPIK